MLDGTEVTRFSEKPAGATLISGGFFVFDRAVLDRLSPDPSCVLERGPLEELAADGELRVFRHDGFWQCADTMRDVEHLRGLWDRGDAPWRVWDDRRARSRHRRRPPPLRRRAGAARRGRDPVSAVSAQRADAARRLVLEAAIAAGTCHIGSSLSIVDVLAVLYADVLPAGPAPGHRFLLSKGHAASALYATLAGAGVLEPAEVVAGTARTAGASPAIPSAACRASR